MMFERLTQERWIGDRKRWVAFDAICLDDGIVGKAINRLAAYEDSGLSPEEVHKLVKVLKQARESLQAAWEDEGSTTVGKQILETIKAIDELLKGE